MLIDIEIDRIVRKRSRTLYNTRNQSTVLNDHGWNETLQDMLNAYE